MSDSNNRKTDGANVIGSQRRPEYGTVVIAKFREGRWTEDWEMVAAGISREIGEQGKFRWWLIGSDRSFEFDAVEEWAVLGNKDDYSWLHPDIARQLRPHWSTRPEYRHCAPYVS